jgi:predicted DNA-binding transcriptional regulator YafY
MTPHRLFRLLALLRSWQTRDKLARRLRCSDRQVTRDLAALRRLGFRLESRIIDDAGQKAWRIVGADATLRRLTSG